MATRRGRPPKGAAHAHKVEGSDEVKQRLELILRTLSGELTVAEAAEQLGVGEAHFYRLRERALLGAAEALEPRAAGRPRREPEPTKDDRTSELEAQVRELTGELRAAELREQLALVMPHVLQPPAEEPGEKRRRRNERKRRRRAQRGKR